MPLTKTEAKLAEETVEMIREHAEHITEPVRVSPARMAAFHKASRMRMTLNINGQSILMVEDQNAPRLREAIAEACVTELEPKTLALKAVGTCSECSAMTVQLPDGDIMCVRCRCVQAQPTTALPSDSPEHPTTQAQAQAQLNSHIVLASERAKAH